MQTRILYTKIFYLLILLFLNTAAIAKTISGTGKISGNVVDKATGLPIAGASVYLPDLKAGAITDSAGRYIIDQLPLGRYLVRVKAIGYITVSQNVDLAKTSLLDFQLNSSRYELADVLVTAPGYATFKRRTPVPITVVTHDMILQGTANTAIDEIASQPGINETTEGPGTTKPQINGLGFDRVLTLMDGIPQEDFQWGDDHGILIDPYAVYEAEIIRGPASLQYGASAEAGVISFKSAPLPQNGTVLGSVLTEYHTNNGYLGTSVNIAGNRNGFVWGLQASGEEAHSYSNPKDGYVWGTAWNQVNGRLKFGINKSWAYSRLTLSALHRRIEVPDGNRDSTGRFIFDTPINGKVYPTSSDFLIPIPPI